MVDKIAPLAVYDATYRADELTTVSAVVSGRLRRSDAFSTRHLFRLFDFLESFLDLHEVVDMERWLEAGHTSSRGKEGGLSAGGAA